MIGDYDFSDTDCPDECEPGCCKQERRLWLVPVILGIGFVGAVLMGWWVS